MPFGKREAQRFFVSGISRYVKYKVEFGLGIYKSCTDETTIVISVYVWHSSRLMRPRQSPNGQTRLLVFKFDKSRISRYVTVIILNV